MIFCLLGLVGIQCTSIRPLEGIRGAVITGKIMDGNSNEALIGMNVHEIDYLDSSTLTDPSGHFQLTLQGDVPVIVLSGAYEPIYVKVKIDSFNLIVINNALMRESMKLSRKLN